MSRSAKATMPSHFCNTKTTNVNTSQKAKITFTNTTFYGKASDYCNQIHTKIYAKSSIRQSSTQTTKILREKKRTINCATERFKTGSVSVLMKGTAASVMTTSANIALGF